MCKCDPSVRTPYCGRPGCEWPSPSGCLVTDGPGKPKPQGNPCYDEPTDKPPLGVMPQNLWEEKVREQRRHDLRQAIKRFIEADRDIPMAWTDELAEIEHGSTKL